MCITILVAKLVSADKIKIRVSGRKNKTHAAKIPTIVDLPECLNAIMNANLVQLQFFTDPQMVDLGEKAEVTMMITDQALGQVKILLH